MRVEAALVALCLCVISVAAVPRVSHKIVGGSATTINQYPSVAALLYTNDLNTYYQECVGSILNIRSILTAANCIYEDAVNRWRVRVGSSYANAGGSVYAAGYFLIHPNFDSWNFDADLAIIQTSVYITFVTNTVQAASIAGNLYVPGDNQPVWAAGWGATYAGGSSSEQLRHVQVYTINYETCRSRYTALGWPVTDNMICSGWLDVGGRGQCQGDYGSPVYHNGVVIGLYSWQYQCGLPSYPAVNTRVSSYTTWIQLNA